MKHTIRMDQSIVRCSYGFCLVSLKQVKNSLRDAKH